MHYIEINKLHDAGKFMYRAAILGNKIANEWLHKEHSIKKIEAERLYQLGLFYSRPSLSMPLMEKSSALGHKFANKWLKNIIKSDKKISLKEVQVRNGDKYFSCLGDSTHSFGYIYILVNASFQRDFIKIGRTQREPILRANELSKKTSLPSEFLVAYQRYVNDCELAEKLIHQNLSKYRVTDYRIDRSREFFKIPLASAIREVDRIIDEIMETKKL